MTEIELKAHVDDRNALIQKLTSFATYKGAVTRDDTYYTRSKEKGSIKIRIRRETRTVESNAIETTWLVTYKRKEMRTDNTTGTSIEVNDEKESEISSPEALVAFLIDTGYFVDLQKHKEVQDWSFPLSTAHDHLTATFELCTVPPLGDFLEIEVLSPLSDEKTVASIHQELESLLEKSGIPKDRIENRYYSELLKDLPR